MYRRRSYRRSSRKYPSNFGTRYFSSRPIAGKYRTSSRYVLTRGARRLFRGGKRRFERYLRATAEHKYFDYELDSSPTNQPCLAQTGVLFAVSDPDQGFRDTERVGDKCTGTSIQLRYSVQSIPTTTSAINFQCRVTIFVWRDDTTPVTGDIFQIIPTDSSPGTITAIQPNEYMFNHDKKIKRRVLYDRVHNAYNSGDGTSTAFTVWTPFPSVHANIPLTRLGRDAIVNWQGGTATAVNKIYCLILANTAPANTCWYINTRTRYNYVDC